MRIRSTAVEIQKMGGDADGASETVSKLRDKLLALTNQKVDIKLDEKTYKSTYQILLEMSKVWKDMSDTEQASALEAMFGVRQANVGASLIQNMKEAQEVLKTSADSAGSALKEQEKYTEGIQYSLDRLKASIQELSITTLHSDTIKFFVDFLNSVTNVTTSLGGLVPILSIVATIFLSFTKNTKFTFLQDFIMKLIAMRTGAESTTIAINGLTMSTKALSFAIGSGVLLLITGLVTAISNYQQSVEEARQKSIALTAQFKDTSTTLEGQISLYKDLNDKLKSDNITIAEAKSIKEQLATIQDTLVKKYGLEADALDLVNGKYDEQIAKLSQVSVLKAQEYIALNSSSYDKAKEQVNAKQTFSLTGDYNDKIDNEIAEYLKNYEGISVDYVNRGLLGSFGSVEIPDATVNEAIDILSKLFTDIGNQFGDSQGAKDFQAKITSLITFLDTDKLKEANDEIAVYEKALILSNSTLNSLYTKSTQAIDDYKKSLETGESVDEAIANLYRVKQEVFANVDAVDGADKFFDTLFSTIATVATRTADTMGGLADKNSNFFTTYATEIDNFQKSLKTIGTALSNVATLSSSDITDLMQEFSDFDWERYGVTGEKGVGNVEQALKDLATQEYINIASTIGMNDALTAMYRDTINTNNIISQLTENVSKEKQVNEDFYDSIIKNITSTVNKQAEQYDIDFSNYKTLIEAKIALYKEYAILQQKLINAENNFKNVMFSGDTERIKQLGTDYINASKGFQEFIDLATDFSAIVTDANGNSDKGKKDYLQTVDWTTQSLSNLQNAVGDAQRILDNTEGYDNQITAINNLITAQQNLRDGYNKASQSYKSQYDAIDGIDNYKKLIEGGSTFTSTDFTDEALAQKVLHAQDLWNGYQENADKVIDVNNDIADSFDLITEKTRGNLQDTLDNFDNQIKDIQGQKDDILNAIEEAEANGGTATKEQYDALKALNDNMITLYQTKKDIAEQELLNTPNTLENTKYISELKGTIQECENAISDCVVEQSEWNQKILQLPIDKLKEANKELQESVNTAKKLKESYDKAIQGVIYFLSLEIDTLNAQKDAINDESIVGSYGYRIKQLRDEIELLEKQNRQRQKALDKQKALYDLEDARNQKIHKVYREGQGFVFEVDTDAVRKAQETLDNLAYEEMIDAKKEELDRLEDEKDALIANLDKEIDRLNKISEQWQKIAEIWIMLASMSIADALLPSGWQDRILSGDLSDYNQMLSEYLGIQNDISEGEAQIEQNNGMIGKLEEYAEAWNTTKGDIEVAYNKIQEMLKETLTETNATQTRIDKTLEYKDSWNTAYTGINTSLGNIETAQTSAKTTEGKILNDRLTQLRQFAQDYMSIMSSIGSDGTGDLPVSKGSSRIDFGSINTHDNLSLKNILSQTKTTSASVVPINQNNNSFAFTGDIIIESADNANELSDDIVAKFIPYMNQKLNK
jgi:chromosome segregation ATPase